ncbi:hypothetical protein HGRIS_007932 [Hohenbuehelia grisea]
MLFHACPPLHQWRHDHDQAFNTFLQYKTQVPVCGAIMLNETWDKCVLVKGWKASSGWGFPKGKINESEPQHLCAVREVLEETGYNLADQINPEHVLETEIRDQRVSLYIVPGVPEDYPFETKTRKEISKIEWFRLTDLPGWKRNKNVPGKFYLIHPFIGPLRKFIQRYNPKSRRISAQPVMPTTHEEEEDESETFLAVQTDSTDAAQESSSGPQTPSPQYTQAVAHSVPKVQHADDVNAQLNVDKLDPHFARLLSSLTLSATGIKPNGSDSEKPLAPASASVSISNGPTALSSLSPAKVSPAANKPISVPKSAATFPSPAQATALPPSSQVAPSVPASKPSAATQAIKPPVSSKSPPASVDPSTAGPRPSSSASTLPLSPRTRGMGSRRTSSTADISPYLTRPAEVPSSAKRLRELALLEAISDESARMTPVLRQRDGGGQGNLNGRHSAVPAQFHPNFLPPHPSAIHPTPNDLRVIYSSQPVAGLPMNLNPATPLIPSATPNMAFGPAPFQVRPHTSQAFSRNGPYSPAPLAGFQHSMYGMMNAPPGGFPSGQPIYQPIFNAPHPYGTFLPHGPPMPSAVNPLPVVSPLQGSAMPAQAPVGLPMSGTALPGPGLPALPPLQAGAAPNLGHARPPPAANPGQAAQLLSILNAPPSM